MPATCHPDGQYPLMNLHRGIISSLLVIFCRQEIQNEEFIFYCLLLSEKEQLNWVLSTKQKVKCIWHFFFHRNILTKVIFVRATAIWAERGAECRKTERSGTRY